MASKDKEELILDAARKVFVEKGPVNARMQDIADEADITPSLLHYYYRKRDDLYEAVVEQEIRRLIPKQAALLSSDRPLEEKLAEFARRLIDFHAANPHHAAFIAFESHYNERHLERLRDAFAHLDLEALQNELDARSHRGESVPGDARHLLMNILSLCIFPFIVSPIFRAIFEVDEDAYRQILEQRKEEVPTFIRMALRTCD